MFIVLNQRAVLYSTLIGRNNYTCQKCDQTTELPESGKKLVTKTYFSPLCMKEAVASEQKANYGKMKSQIQEYDHIQIKDTAI